MKNHKVRLDILRLRMSINFLVDPSALAGTRMLKLKTLSFSLACVSKIQQFCRLRSISNIVNSCSPFWSGHNRNFEWVFQTVPGTWFTELELLKSQKSGMQTVQSSQRSWISTKMTLQWKVWLVWARNPVFFFYSMYLSQDGSVVVVPQLLVVPSIMYNRKYHLKLNKKASEVWAATEKTQVLRMAWYELLSTQEES